jgi:predicted SPOUT superfamily RNA methylase MTH1
VKSLLAENKAMSNRFKLDVFLSDCTFENEPDLLRSTLKAGIIARALAIYRVDRVVIYKGRRDKACSELGEKLEKLLWYQVVPPYLKRKIIPRSPVYRYAGLLPPLQIDTHIVTDPPSIGEVRLGLVKRRAKRKLVVDVGLRSDVEVMVNGETGPRLRELVPVEFTGEGWRILKEGNVYLGFEVIYERDRDIVSLMRSYGGLRIGTSRLGFPAWEAGGKLVSSISPGDRVAVVFGEPYRGLREIVDEHGGRVEELFDFYLNFIPGQGTRTVRVEEALVAVLQTIIFLNHVYRSI